MACSISFLIKSPPPTSETTFSKALHNACYWPSLSSSWKKQLAPSRCKLFSQLYNTYTDFLPVVYINWSEGLNHLGATTQWPFEQLFTIYRAIIALIMSNWAPFSSGNGEWPATLSVNVLPQARKYYWKKWQLFQDAAQITCHSWLTKCSCRAFCTSSVCYLENTDQKLCRKSGLGAFQLLMALIALTTFPSDTAVWHFHFPL